MTIFSHHTTIDGAERSWVVDINAVAAVVPWAARRPEALTADLAGMAAYFPHWLLAGSRGGKPAHCERCSAPLVPTAGAIRCAGCSSTGQFEGMVWLGHIPALARPERAFARRWAPVGRRTRTPVVRA